MEKPKTSLNWFTFGIGARNISKFHCFTRNGTSFQTLIFQVGVLYAPKFILYIYNVGSLYTCTCDSNGLTLGCTQCLTFCFIGPSLETIHTLNTPKVDIMKALPLPNLFWVSFKNWKFKN
jgi:hypothetical protein